MVLAIGLMSGTSLDGIDAALIETDGLDRVEPMGSLTVPYEEELRRRLRAILGREAPDEETTAVERDLTTAHAAAVAELLRREGRAASTVALAGFHGHTILHRPEARLTWQLGDGALLARETGIDVVADFRIADVAAGGQGAPFAPAYHAARASGLERPVAILNLGGVANVTWIGEDGLLLAFDTGPANALLDDWAQQHTGVPSDIDGRLARSGEIDESALDRLLAIPYFEQPPPKSLDRIAFDLAPVAHLSPAAGAATLTAFTAESVRRACRFLPALPRRWLVCGGGRCNPALMAALSQRLAARVEAVEAVGWDGDALEAQAFAYLAVRSRQGLPLSWPGTTGVPTPMTGGRLYRVAPRS